MDIKEVNCIMNERIETLVEKNVDAYKKQREEVVGLIQEYINFVVPTFGQYQTQFILPKNNVYQIRLYNQYTDEYEWCCVQSIRTLNDKAQIELNSQWYNIEDIDVETLIKLYQAIKKEVSKI